MNGLLAVAGGRIYVKLDRVFPVTFAESYLSAAIPSAPLPSSTCSLTSSRD
jgi:hypothetical protein